MSNKPMRQDLILRILGEDLFSGTLQKTTNNLKKQSKSLGGYFTNINKHYQGLIKNAKNLLQNGKNGSVSIIDPLLQQNLKTAERDFNKAEQAFQIFKDKRISNLEDYNKQITALNNTIAKNQKLQNQILSQPLKNTTKFKTASGKPAQQLKDLLTDKIAKSQVGKFYRDLQTVFSGSARLAGGVSAFWKTIDTALGEKLSIQSVKNELKQKHVKAFLKDWNKNESLYKVANGYSPNAMVVPFNGQKITYDEAKSKAEIYQHLKGLSQSNTRRSAIAKWLSTSPETQKDLTNRIAGSVLYRDLTYFQQTGQMPTDSGRAKAVTDWLNQNGFTRERSWHYYNAKNLEGKANKEKTYLENLRPKLEERSKVYTEAFTKYNDLKAQIDSAPKITQDDITQGQRALARTLINLASPKKENYFNKLAESVALTSGEDRTRLLNSIRAQSQEYTYYADNIMRMFGLDPKSGRWYYNKHSKVNFKQHLQEVAKEKGLSIGDQGLLTNLFNTVTNSVIDPANNIKEDLKGEVSRKAYLKQFKTADQGFIQNLRTPLTTNINEIKQYREDVRKLDTARGHILNTLNTYNGIKLNQDFKQEDLDKALKNSNITYKNQRDRVQELGRAYLTASNKREELNTAIQEGEKLKLLGYDTNQIKELNKQSSSILNNAKAIQKTEPYKQLLAGNAVTANDFKNTQETTADLKNAVQGYVKAFGKLGISNVSAGIREENLDRNIALFKQGEAYNRLSTAERAVFNRNVENLKSGFVPVNNAYRSFTAVSEVQSRNRSKALETPEQQAKQLQRNRLDDINQTNMSLYALSHALKAVEVPLQQAYDYGKGSIDEYVNFQSAMVGVAKLLPALRDKDTLLINKRFEDFRQGVLNLTETLPMSGVELAKASESASRLGVTNPDQIRKVVETGTKLGVAFGMSPDDVTKQVVKIANAKGIDLNKSDSLDKVMEFADAINYLDDHTAASGREIINFTKKAVQTAEGVKMDTKDVSAFGATLVSLGISADSANTGFKNLMTVLQTGPRNQKKGAEYLEKSGYSVKELTTLFKKNPTETAVAFIKRLNKLRNAPAGSDAAAIVRFAFGQMSSQAIMALVNNPEVLEKYLKMARQDSKGWTEKEFKARQINDPIVRFQLLQNKIKSLQVDIGEALMPLADTFITNIKDMSKAIAPIVKENPQLIRNTAYAGLGLLSAVKIASLTTDIATIFNNLRHFKSFQKLADKWTHLKSLSPVIKSLSSGKQGWLGSLLSIPLGSAEGVAGWGGLTLGSVLGGTAIAGGIGTGIGLLLRQLNIADLWNWLGKWTGLSNGQQTVYLGNDKAVYQQEQKENIAQNKAQGIIADRQRRATAEHGSVYTEKRLEDIKYQIEKSGYKIHRNETGQIYLTKSKKDLKTGKMFDSGEAMEFGTLSDIQGEQRYLIPIKTKKDLMNLTGSLQRSDIEFNSNVLTENKNSELFALIDSLKYLDIQLQAQRRKEGIAPNIETIASIDDTNKKAYTQLRNKQIEKHKERASLETEKKLIDDKIANITSVDSSKIDLVQLGKYQQKLDEVTKKLKKVKTSQKYLRELLEYTDLATPNSIQDTINKNEVKKNKKSALINLTKMGASAITSALGVATSPSETTKFLFDQYSKAIEERNSLVPFKDNASWVQKLPKDIQDKGKKQYYEANDKQYSLGLQFSEATKNMQINDWLKFSNLSNQQSPLEQIFGINVQQLMDSANQKQELINKTMGLTMQNTVNLYGENEKVGKSFTSIQYSSQEAFNHLSQSASKTAKGIASDIGGALDEIYAKIELINSTTISPKVGKPITITISGGEGGGDSPPRKGYNKQE